jgi:hypothetical protein
LIGCSAPPPRVITGQLHASDFTLDNPVVVAESADSRVFVTHVFADGSFRLEVPAGVAYRLTLANSTVTSAYTTVARINWPLASGPSRWAVVQPGAPLDLGDIYQRGSAPTVTAGATLSISCASCGGSSGGSNDSGGGSNDSGGGNTSGGSSGGSHEADKSGDCHESDHSYCDKSTKESDCDSAHKPDKSDACDKDNDADEHDKKCDSDNKKKHDDDSAKQKPDSGSSCGCQGGDDDGHGDDDESGTKTGGSTAGGTTAGAGMTGAGGQAGATGAGDTAGSTSGGKMPAPTTSGGTSGAGSCAVTADCSGGLTCCASTCKQPTWK